MCNVQHVHRKQLLQREKRQRDRKRIDYVSVSIRQLSSLVQVSFNKRNVNALFLLPQYIC